MASHRRIADSRHFTCYAWLPTVNFYDADIVRVYGSAYVVVRTVALLGAADLVARLNRRVARLACR